jgi:3',5'-cyclic-AMP phosphodiesterase
MTAINTPAIVMIPGDLHLTEPGLDNHKTALWAVEDANNFIRPDFVQFIGDNTQDATDGQYRLFHNVTSGLARPWYALVGDHDVKGDPQAAGFRKWIGEPHGALRLQGFRFLRLNTQEARPVGLLDPQVDWFRLEVDDAAAAGERVVVFQHNYPYQIWEDYAGPGIDAWRAIVQTRRIHGIFCGHTHYWQVANDGRNVHVATRSIGDPEGGPPGYMVLYLCGEDLAVAYRTVEDRGPLVLITSPRDAIFCMGPDHVVCDGSAITARVWSRAPVAEVWARVDDDPPFPLEAVDSLDWCGPLSYAKLAKGAHRLRVRAVDRSGDTGERSIEFAVDPTGRYTAVPRVHPVVTATKFC